MIFQVGITSKSHETITDIEILKKLNELRIQKMPLLQMMDPEYQINNKMIGRKVLAHAEKAGEVVEDQHGSRKNHKAITACLNKNMLCDILRQKKLTGAIAMNDAKGCYDRIAHPVAVLTLLHFGVSTLVCLALFKTLQQAKHHYIKTGFGRSEAAYGDEDIPVSGIGQGNGLGPTLWALISTVLIWMMERHGHSVDLLNSIEGEDIKEEFQVALDRWAGGLIATGGLAPVKSFCYMIDFEWTGKDWKYRSMADMPGEFNLLMGDGTWEPLQQHEVDYAEKILGVFVSMDGNENAE